MKNSTFIFTFFISILIFSCESTEKIENTPSGKHLKIQGIPVSIVPPPGHLLDMTDPGFYSNHSFIVLEPSDLTLEQLMYKFSDSLLSKQGIATIAENAILINGFKGRKILLQENVNGISYAKTLLLFGDKNHSVVVNGTYPTDSSRLSTIIESALSTLIFNPNLVNHDSLSVYFDFKDKQGFKVATILNAGIKLTNTGYEAWEANDAFLDAYVQLLYVAEDNRMDFIKQSISYLGETQSNVKIVEIEMAGLTGYEITDIDQQRLMYRVYLFSDQKVYQIVAAARVDHEAYLAKFKAIAGNMVLLQ